MFLGSFIMNNGTTLNLKDLGYKEMGGSYKCTVTGIGGQNNGRSTLDVYCKYESAML